MAHVPQIESTTKLPRADRSAQTPPNPGSYRAGPAEEATHSYQSWPASNSPGARGRTNEITSKQPATRGPWSQTKDAPTDEWLKPWPKGGPDSGGRFFK